MKTLFSAVCLLASLFLTKGHALDDYTPQLIDIGDYDFLVIHIDNDLVPASFSFISNGDGASFKNVSKDKVSYRVDKKIKSLEQILKKLRELRVLAESFPMESFFEKKDIGVNATRMARLFSELIGMEELGDMDSVWIGPENTSEPLKQFFRHQLYSSVHKVVRQNMVVPASSGYFSAIKAAAWDKAAKRQFWSTLASSFPNVSPGVFQGSETFQLKHLREMIDMASGGFHQLFSNQYSCAFLLEKR